MRWRMIIWIRRCAGMLLVVSVFSPLSTGLGASPTLPVPRTRGYMRALVNVNQGLPAYSGYLGKEGLLTDLVFQYGQNTPVKSFDEAKSWFTSHFPPASLGVYCSSRALTPANAQQFDPPNCLTPDQFAESELLPPPFLTKDCGLSITASLQPEPNWSPVWYKRQNRSKLNGCMPTIGRTRAPGLATSTGPTR